MKNFQFDFHKSHLRRNYGFPLRNRLYPDSPIWSFSRLKTSYAYFHNDAIMTSLWRKNQIRRMVTQMTRFWSDSFWCGKSSRKTYFWLQNGPTQFHPDGNLFSFNFQNQSKIFDCSIFWKFCVKKFFDCWKVLKAPKIDFSFFCENILYFCTNCCIHMCNHPAYLYILHCDRSCENQ